MVVIKDFRNMFWGVTIDGGKRYSQMVEKSFHISMAALDPSSAKGCVSLMIQHEKAEFLLCSLDTKHIYQQALDLNFTEGEEVTFFLTGAGIVHLTGFLLEDEEEEDYDQYGQSMDSDMFESSDEEAPELVSPASSNRKKASDVKRKLVNTLSGIPVKRKKAEQYDDDDSEEDSSDDDDDDDMFLDDEALEDSIEEQDEMSAESSEEEEEEMKTPSSKRKSNSVSKQEKKKQTPKNKPKASTPKSVSSSTKSPMPETPQTEERTESGDTTEGKKKKKKKKKNKAGEEATPNGSQESGKKPKAQEKATPQKKVVSGGTVVEEIKVGHGPEAKPGKMVHVYYSGKLTSGKQFDSCMSGKPFRFKLGKQEVIKGWDNGVSGMKVGGKRRLTVPATQGYGNQRQGPIPPNSTLVFEVELKAVS